MTAAAVVALISACVSVVVTGYGILERRRAFNAEQRERDRQARQWKKEIDAERTRQEVLLRKEFLLEQYRYRIESYADVLKTLGAVPDVGLSAFDPYGPFRDDPQVLAKTASDLGEHLYGRAGLLMTMHTRNVLHNARQTCLAFLSSNGGSTEGDRLVSAFFSSATCLAGGLRPDR